MRERKVKLRISAEVLEKAKEMGLNISKICENALREKIRLLRTKAEMT